MPTVETDNVADFVTELLNKARAGFFEATAVKAPAPQVTVTDVDHIVTCHWRVDFNDGKTRPCLASTVQPWTRPQLLATRRDKSNLALNVTPQRPYFQDEIMQQISPEPVSVTLDTTPAPAAALTDNPVSVTLDTQPAPAIELTGNIVTVTQQYDKARDILQQEEITVCIVDTLAGAKVAINTLCKRDNGLPFGIDIETAPLPDYHGTKHGGLNPHSSIIRLVQIYPGKQYQENVVYVFDLFKLGGIESLTPLFDNRRFVAHNAVFELKHLLHCGVNLQQIDCTMLMANAYYNGGRHSLADLADTILGWRIDKTEQKGNWAAANLTREQYEYAALDAVAAYCLFIWLEPALKEVGRVQCYDLMRNAQSAMARLELAGCPFNTAAHTELLARYQLIAETARGELDSLLGINPDSPAQLAQWLAEHLPPDTINRWPRTAKGALATDADTLSSLTLPELEPLARYKKARKMLSTYGTSYAAHIHPQTKRIHPSFLIAGTDTGRLSCRNPNVQNPPRDSEFRALFAPNNGRVLVVADYSQIELRVAAQVSGDKNMLRAYSNGEDLHRLTAAAIAGKAPADISKSERQMAKAVNFGLLFGAGAPSLQNYAATAYCVDMTLAQAQAARAAFFRTYPEFEKWQKKQRKGAATAGQVRTPGGRVRALDGARALATESLNTPIQGGAAEVLLVTLALLTTQLDALGAQLVNVIHDEIVVECAPNNAPAVATAMEAAMVAGFLAIFPSASTRELVEAHWGANWAEAKG